MVYGGNWIVSTSFIFIVLCFNLFYSMKNTLQKFYSLMLACFLLLITTAQAQTKYHRIQAYLTREKFMEVKQAGLSVDHYDYHNDTLYADVSAEDVNILKSKHVKVKFIIRDLEKNIHAHNAKIDKAAAKAAKTRAVTVPTPVNFGIGGSYGTSTAVAKHFTFQEMLNELDAMRTLYPNLISIKTSIGTTEQNRGVFMVRLSDNPDVDENEPECLMTGVHHAREPISMTQLIFFLWHLLENYATDKEIQQLVNSSELYVVPCVNPDGYVYNQTTNATGGGLWRKNRRNNGGNVFGVDPNRNYDHDFGGLGTSATPSSDIYKGPSAFSEPETQAIRNLSNAHQFITAFHNHSYGNYCIYPYSNVNVNNCPEIPFFNQLSIFLTTDNAFTYGNAYQTVAYSAAGGAEDWGYAEQVTKPKTYGFTPEIGLSSDGFWPAASRIIPLCNSMMVMNKNLLKLTTRYATVTSTAPSTFGNLSSTLPFNIKSYCITPSTYTVSINPLSPLVTSVSAAKVFSGMTTFQTLNDAFSFNVNPTISVGSTVSFEVLTQNGFHTRKDTVTMQYACPTLTGATTTGITSSTATLSWAPVVGVTGYHVSYKLNSATTWSSNTTVTTPNFTLSSLLPSTAYQWRVKIATCSNYSTVQNFTTFAPCGIPASSITAVGVNSFSLSWPSIPNAQSYNVQTRPLGSSTWSTQVVSTTNCTTNALSASTIYEFQLNVVCSGGVGPYSPVQTVSTTAPIVYCGSNGNSNTEEWIDYFSMSGINRSSGQETGGYILSGQAAGLQLGGSYSFLFSAGFSSTVRKENWRAYIDFNQDGDFTDAGEIVASTLTADGSIHTKTFTVPANAQTGNTRMRVQMFRGYGLMINPCGTYSYGEVEDYTVKITPKALSKNTIEEWMKPNELAVEIIPNPFDDFIELTLLDDSVVAESVITMYDLYGKKVYEEKLPHTQLKHNLNTRHLSTGIYLLQVQRGEKSKTQKMIK
jgi:hypothetical protein